jgi:hypothetical protein
VFAALSFRSGALSFPVAMRWVNIRAAIFALLLLLLAVVVILSPDYVPP